MNGYKIRPKKSLSQNFLYDRKILLRIIKTAEVTEKDTVVEIGPGTGALTMMLARHAAHVVAIELDRQLYEILNKKITEAGIENITLVQGDALRFDFSGLGRFKVVANIPYHITTPLIFRLLDCRENLSSMTLTVQKEVAQRIVASPGGKDYGVLSLMVQYYGEPEIKFIIPRGAFRPVPEVDSACLHIKIFKKPKTEVKNEECLFKIIKTAFGKRRKTILNSLKPLAADIKGVLETVGIDPMRRPETLSLEEFAQLANKLCD